MRSSSGGCERNKAARPWRTPLLMPKATSESGIWLGTSYSAFRRCRALTMSRRSASCAPATSARYSRRRENHMTMVLAAMPKMISATNTTM